jgi:hypothetical protein
MIMPGRWRTPITTGHDLRPTSGTPQAGPVAPGGAFDPDDIAAHYWLLYRQPPDQWEHEVLFAGPTGAALRQSA